MPVRSGRVMIICYALSAAQRPDPPCPQRILHIRHLLASGPDPFLAQSAPRRKGRGLLARAFATSHIPLCGIDENRPKVASRSTDDCFGATPIRPGPPAAGPRSLMGSIAQEKRLARVHPFL